MDNETKKKIGAGLGATGSGILGAKLGWAAYLALIAVNPAAVIFAAGLPFAAGGLGALLGGKAGYESPSVGLCSAVNRIFGMPGSDLDGAGDTGPLDS